MRSLPMPLEPETLVGSKPCLWKGHPDKSLRILPHQRLSWKLGKNRRQRKGLVCFHDLNSRFANMAEVLQQLGARLTKPEEYAQWGESLKEKMSKGFHLVSDDKKNPSTTRPFGKTSNKDMEEEEDQKPIELDLPFLSCTTVDTETSKGNLSAAAISCIEQFGRLSGVTGKKMKYDFYSDAPSTAQSEARNLVEYCCFRYLSRFGTDLHPSIKEARFRRLIFITMLAWQQPYVDNSYNNDKGSSEKERTQAGNVAWVVKEDAFVRIAPAVAGVADKSTAHHLYKVLTNERDGLSLRVWDKYLLELARVYEQMLSYTNEVRSTLELTDHESVLYVAADKRPPVQMWNEKNIAWPGRLTLTNRALYFQPNAIVQHWKRMKLNLQGGLGYVKRTKVGPFGAELFDSAIEVMPGGKSESWVLEFIDFSGEGLREVWFAFVQEILSAFSFIEEYGPASKDPLVRHVYGSEMGHKKVVTSAIGGIARVQAVQATLGRLLRNPGRLLQFSYITDAPSGELVKQALAVSFWGGTLDKDGSAKSSLFGNPQLASDAIGTGLYLVDVDGSVFLQRWMKSSTWGTSKSLNFWKHKAGGKGLVLGKELVVGDLTYLDKAVKVCKDKTQMLEKTKATIDGALVKGIPSNIDLLKELMLPFTILSINLRKLQKWEDPVATTLFLSLSSFILYKNWLRYVFPTVLLLAALFIFTLHNLKSKGRLGDGFGRVTIREPPPSNTLQKILALKEALTEVELQIQKSNIALLKLRSLALSKHPEATKWILLVLVGSALTFLFVPFRYICAFILFDQFTCELKFRKGMVIKMMRQVKDWWQTIPAAPVEVLPHENHSDRDPGNTASEVDEHAQPTKGEVIAETVREWFAESF